MHTNSLSNLIMGNARQPAPRVGMGARSVADTGLRSASVTSTTISVGIYIPYSLDMREGVNYHWSRT